MEHPAFYLLGIPSACIAGAIDWRQYRRMGPRKNKLRFYIRCVTVTILCSILDGLHRPEPKIKA